MSDSVDVHYMRMALREARKGLGRTSPNPCVGAVIVKDGQVIAKGYHHKAGTAHAEINALAAARQSVRGATMYVTLEPCNHIGRTPPCTKAIVESGLARVVVGLRDPNPLVDGTGIAFLITQGVEVVSGVLEEECREMNHFFIKHIRTGLPWVILKAGVSLDGRLNYQRGQSGWLTGPQAVAKAHRLRDQVDAILVGSGTVKIDDPSLTTRLASGRGRDAIRVVIDSDLSTSLNSRVYALQSQAPTWVFCRENAPADRRVAFESKKIRVMSVSGGRSGVCLKKVLTRLGQEAVCSLLVEGGARIHGTLLRERLADFAHLLYAPIFAGDGGVPLIESFVARDRHSAPRLTGVRLHRLGEDILLSGKLTYPL
jgi:diaminohydroxyphosphoribosylaminopyrimidine deaminase / 5-amino-6-(5-phosphoribosylamino)uracil reductase